MSTTVAVGASNVNAVGTRVLTTTITDSAAGSSSVTPAPPLNIISNAFAILASQPVQTINGTVAVPIPVGAQGVAWQAPAAGASTLNIKTVSADAGIPLSKIANGYFYWDTTQPVSGNVYITSNGIELVTLFWL